MYKWIAALWGTAALITLPACTRTDGGHPAGSAATYSMLDDQGSQLRRDFNRSKGSVRLLFVVDPVCPGCLRGMDDMNEDLLAATDDPRLQTFVVHLPVIGATEGDVAPSMKLLQNPHVKHYWNASGAFGRQLGKSVGLMRGDELVYAWDVWLLYGPEATWGPDGPPRPRLLMHQLWALQDSEEFPFLDSEVFAGEVHRLLAELPPTPTASTAE
ncbi:MAG: hypothetical protein ACREVN_06430 [Gammaproteobacteria bacterium]